MPELETDPVSEMADQLAETVVLPVPIQCRGAQGIWRLPDDVYAIVRGGYRQAKNRPQSRQF